jgi:nucleoid DNA-binding protein
MAMGPTLTRTDLIQSTARRTDLPSAQVGAVIDAFLELVGEALCRDEVVQIRRFGTLSVHEEPPTRAGKGSSGEGARRAVRFKESRDLLDREEIGPSSRAGGRRSRSTSELASAGHSTEDLEHIRSRAMTMLEEGRSLSEVARRTGISPSRVSFWWHSHRAGLY